MEGKMEEFQHASKLAVGLEVPKIGLKFLLEYRARCSDSAYVCRGRVDVLRPMVDMAARTAGV